MSDEVDLTPAKFATAVAPAIDRVFSSGIRAPRDAGGHDLIMAYGGPRAIGYLVDLRNPLAAGRTVSADGLLAHYRHDSPDRVHEAVQRSVEHGMLEPQGDGGIAATDRCHKFLADLYALHAEVLAELWEAEHGERVERLASVLGHLVDAAGSSGGRAWSVQAPPHEPSDATASVLLLNRLSAMRAHRADAVGDGSDERAAAPYAALAAEERVQLLADLAALP